MGSSNTHGNAEKAGYSKASTMSSGQRRQQKQLLKQAAPNQQAAAQAFQSFLGPEAGKEYIAQANQRFQQQTIPSIVNALGSDAKTSSALNQALAAGAANLNTDIASHLAGLRLQGAQGLSGLGLQQAQLAQSPEFAYLQKQMPFWQHATLAGIQAGGKIGGAALGGGA